MAILKIQRDTDERPKDIPNPQSMTWEEFDLDAEDGSGRNQNGDAMRDRVNVKIKLTCVWPPLSTSEMSALLEAVGDVFFDLEHPDARTGARKTTRVYVGDRSAPLYRYNSESDWLWENVSMNFIEK